MCRLRCAREPRGEERDQVLEALGLGTRLRPLAVKVRALRPHASSSLVGNGGAAHCSQPLVRHLEQETHPCDVRRAGGGEEVRGGGGARDEANGRRAQTAECASIHPLNILPLHVYILPPPPTCLQGGRVLSLYWSWSLGASVDCMRVAAVRCPMVRSSSPLKRPSRPSALEPLSPSPLHADEGCIRSLYRRPRLRSTTAVRGSSPSRSSSQAQSSRSSLTPKPPSSLRSTRTPLKSCRCAWSERR